MYHISKIVLLSLLITTSIFADQNNILKNIYHHGGAHGANVPELGSISCYFSVQPRIQKIGAKLLRSDKTRVIYRIANTCLQSEKIIAALPLSTPYYSFAIEPVNDALDLIITYNRRKVALVFDTFDSISLQKGLVIHCVDRMYSAQNKQHKAQQRKKIVVIDCGHGGNDAGAVGCAGIREKDIVLSVGLQVAQLLQKAGLEVKLTRSSDVDVALDKRTSYANESNADLFVSIHANYAKNSAVQGIDTFCMQSRLLHRDVQLSDNDAVALLNNALSERASQSSLLARQVHQTVLASVRTANSGVVDRKVKYEVGQILLGARMPAILIELGFVSHKEEAKRLGGSDYQHMLARGICDGIIAYLKE